MIGSVENTRAHRINNKPIYPCLKLFYILRFFMCWVRIFLSASTMANLSAVKREDVAFKPPNHCYHSIIMTQVVHKVHWKCEIWSFGRWSWPFSTHKPCSRTVWVQADRLVFNSYSFTHKDAWHGWVTMHH
jgi:hypothetical protein